MPQGMPGIGHPTCPQMNQQFRRGWIPFPGSRLWMGADPRAEAHGLEAGPDGPMLRVARHRQADKRWEAPAAVAADRAQAVPIAAKTRASFLSATRAIWRLVVKEPKAAAPCCRRRG